MRPSLETFLPSCRGLDLESAVGGLLDLAQVPGAKVLGRAILRVSLVQAKRLQLRLKLNYVL